MFREFLYWWRQQLAEILPGHLASGSPPRHALLLRIDPPQCGDVSFALRRNSVERSLGSFPAGSQTPSLRQALRPVGRVPSVLGLPEGQLLECDVALPLAAEADAAAALRFEVERLTPFKSDDVFWSWAVVRRDRKRRRLHLRLFMVARKLVAEAMATAAGMGVPVSMLEGRTVEGRIFVVPVVAQVPQPWQRPAFRAAAASCILLALGIATMPILRQASALAEIDDRMAALDAGLREAQAIRQRVSLATGTRDQLATAEAEFGNATALLGALTDALPDDTFLTDLSVKQRQVSMRGQSANAARLIGILAGNPALRTPQFTAPVTRAANGGQDVFAIAAEAAP